MMIMMKMEEEEEEEECGSDFVIVMAKEMASVLMVVVVAVMMESLCQRVRWWGGGDVYQVPVLVRQSVFAHNPHHSKYEADPPETVSRRSIRLSSSRIPQQQFLLGLLQQRPHR